MIKYFKITNLEENHNGYQYNDGINVLDKEFDKVGSCAIGGLYFTDAAHIIDYLDYGCYLREVILPTMDDDFIMVADGDDKWRANKIILGEKYLLSKISTFEYLGSLGANIMSDKVIEWAVENGYIDIVIYLYSLKPFISVSKYILQNAIRYGQLAIVELAVGLGASIDNSKLFYLACIHGHYDIVKYFCQTDACVDKSRGLSYAAKNGHIDIIHLLVHNGVKIDFEYCIPISRHNNHQDVFTFVASICPYTVIKKNPHLRASITKYAKHLKKQTEQPELTKIDPFIDF